jgi:hypothetical protein
VASPSLHGKGCIYKNKKKEVKFCDVARLRHATSQNFPSFFLFLHCAGYASTVPAAQNCCLVVSEHLFK